VIPASGSNPRPQPPAIPGSNVHSRSGALILLLSINLFNYIDRSILNATEPLISREFFPVADKHTEAKMGLLATGFMVSYMVAAPIFGWLADRVRRWVLIAAGVMIWSLASGATGFVPGLVPDLAMGFWLLLVCRTFVGVGEAAYGPVAPTLLADLYPVSVRGRILSIFYLALPVGSALGYAFGGTIGERYGWRTPFYAVVVPGMLLGLLCFLRREPRRGHADAVHDRRRITFRDYAVLFRTPSYVLNTLGMTAMTFAIGGIAFWMPRFVADYRGGGKLSSVNLTFGAITVVAGLLGTLAGGWLGDRLRPRFPGSYFLVSGVAMLVGFPLIMGIIFMPFPAAWVAIFFAVFCLFFNTGPTNTILANVTHPSIRASAYAITIFVIHALGDAISPPLIGLIAGQFRDEQSGRNNLAAGFLFVSFTVLLGGVVWLLGARHLARDTERAPTSLP
jgi:MFS transporter, Spinster family, sphingosine-1-phosphate transporter